MEDSADGGEEAERTGDNGVLPVVGCGLPVAGWDQGADAGGGEGQPEGVGAAGTAYGVGDGAGLGGGCFKAGDLGAEDELLREADGFDGGEDLIPDLGILAREIEHGDGLRKTV